jgi:hypothetical protein
MKIDIITAYYNQNVYLTEYFTWLDKFILPEFGDKVNIILIDDGSKEYPARDFLPKLTHTNLDLYEIKEDIPWNLSGGRNLGVHVARSNNVCYIDIDSILTKQHITELVNITLNEKEIYQFPNYEYKYFDFKNNKLVYKYLPSPFFMQKQDFLQYPMDEDFCGNWGYENIHWHGVLHKNKFIKKCLNTPIIVTAKTNVDKHKLSQTIFNTNDNSCFQRAGGTNLSRSRQINLELYNRKRKNLKVPENILRFNYELIFSNNKI